MQAIASSFFPARGFEKDGLLIESRIVQANDFVVCTTDISNEHKKCIGECRIPINKLNCERTAVKRSFFEAAVRFTGFTPPWGTFTGIRPVKQLAALGGTSAIEEYKNRYFISDEKAALCLSALKNRESMGLKMDKRDVSLYISIPFCPSRCTYCSFISQAGEKMLKLLPDYLSALFDEIRRTAQLTKERGLTVRSVYIGGGTPAVLDESQISQLLDVINTEFDLSGCIEFTFEAGRPDVICDSKLRAIKVGGADRISINPQTTNDSVLAEIGRRHTAAQFFEAYEMAQKYGFKTINTDLIIGLPTDTQDSFEHSLRSVIALEPQNITVHALCIKHSSELKAQRQTGSTESSAALEMSRFASTALHEAGYLPYYIYKQKDAVAALENTGFAKKGYESYYNIVMMDDLGTVLGMGANASTKMIGYSASPIRFYNHKYPYEYLSDDAALESKISKINACL